MKYLIENELNMNNNNIIDYCMANRNTSASKLFVSVLPTPGGAVSETVIYFSSTRMRKRSVFKRVEGSGGGRSVAFIICHVYLQPILFTPMDLETAAYEPGFVGIRFCQEW